MDGIINLYKPRGLTSAKALYRLRKSTRIRKSGHAGTLDPAAEGVLIICQGRATKLVEALMDQPKVYRATARLDVTSESFDSDYPLEPVDVADPPLAEQIIEACHRFEGEIIQLPPAVSALKVGGQPAYKLKRAGITPQLQPRPTRIYWLHVHRYTWPEIEFELACGRGTYVRALIRDLGRQLGTGGCLTGLIRRSIGPFHIDQSWTFAALESSADPDECVLPIEKARELLARRPIHVPPRPAL